ncbi:type II toxin-antitoxin system HipA family toxin [Hymenobacter aquaticus]|uniref:Type II toxin-antitoxin system HipA family toxin n=1 Tax=Hymenobacter aquaticus TaxID=1867101 RepID=A0A4Z0Q6X8_9BACT|nr:type II toxin-antitoxin system HipA family toxin [Hymenobacter aquaticus]TGE24452.1 type II toxin-antitoxin system HipA family toxin [Hymenobacter aquaticus]
MQIFDVFINGVLAGKIGRPPGQQVVFTLLDEYRHLWPRPVLGQQFEDKPKARYVGKSQKLPAFFANLIPEKGPLRQLIEHSLGLTSRDDLALLVALGEGLPGAVEVRPGTEGAHLLDATQPLVADAAAEPLTDEVAAFRFSLGGVQMKFSVLLDADKLRLPMRNELGNWIVKFGSATYPDLPANEYAIMQWADKAGFEVPECRLLPGASLPELLRTQVGMHEEVFLIRRYDRIGFQRIHQEDFAQVAGLQPDKKYDHWSYETCAAIVRQVSGNAQYEEFIRRLVFMVASGNTDAHLKNWSFLYPDGVNAVLTPLYDQVAVVAWLSPEWALHFAGSKQPDKTDEAAFRRLAQASGGDPERVMQLVNETLSEIAKAWHEGRIFELLPSKHVEILRRFWTKVPLLRGILK